MKVNITNESNSRFESINVIDKNVIAAADCFNKCLVTYVWLNFAFLTMRKDSSTNNSKSFYYLYYTI